jgi:GMP synthase (glutamine-hydrolysing)
MPRGAAPSSFAGYGAVIVFGGWMHPSDEDHYPWLRDEDEFIRALLEAEVPTLGVCLGAQLLVKAIDGPVFRGESPEIGWTQVELTAAATSDPIMSTLPQRFLALNWHRDSWTLPIGSGAIELARSDRYPQACRIGKAAWGIQFHAEATRSKVRSWLEADESVDGDAFWPEVDAHIDAWNAMGRSLCSAFIEFASRAGR